MFFSPYLVVTKDICRAAYSPSVVKVRSDCNRPLAGSNRWIIDLAFRIEASLSAGQFGTERQR
jgi:hypothetical protein